MKKANGVSEINARISGLLEDAEKAGMAGQVDKSQKVLFLDSVKNDVIITDNARS